MFVRLRLRLFRFARWSGLLLTLLILTLYLASARWMFFAQFRSGVMIEALGGRVHLEKFAGSAAPSWSVTRHADRMRYDWRWRGGSGPGWSLHLPLYGPLALVGLATFWMWRAHWRSHRFGPGHCTECGYDLRGAGRGRCPECGRAIIPPATSLSPLRSGPNSPPI